MTLKALTISDKVIPFIYSSTVRQRFADVDLVISCGDLPYYYLEYIIRMLDKPLFFVRGNHANVVEYGRHGTRTKPWRAIDLHRTVINHHGLLMVGFEGSMRYNNGPFQYTDSQMYGYIAQLLPRLFLNRALYGRYLDVLVTHASPRDIHDQPDRCHRGFAAFRWFLQHIRPRYMLHGHIHRSHPNTIMQSTFHKTEVINCYGYREVELLMPNYGKK
ncbi:MAG: metallophosphoesterase [Ardenticatenaceae bacterium]